MRSMILAATLTTGMAAALAGAGMTGCGGQEPAPQTPPPPAPPEPVVTAAPAPADTTPPPPAKPSLAEVIPRTLKGIDDAFNVHDTKKLVTFYADDCAASVYGEPPAHGRQDLERAMGGLFSTFGDAKSAPLRSWAKGNVVIVESAWAGTMTGDFMGIKASKKPVGQLRVSVMWFDDDGLVKEMHEYGDDAGLMAQMAGKKGAPAVPLLPTNAPDVHVARATPDEDKLAAWAKTTDETFSKGDVKAAVASNADDAEYWINFVGGPATKGKKDLTKDLEGFFKAFPDQKWTTVNAWGIDGFSIVEHTVSGTQKGKLGPLPASNKAVTDWHWLDIVQPTIDGKVQRGWGYANLAELLQQTSPPKAPPGTDKAAKPAAPATPAGAPAGSAPKK